MPRCGDVMTEITAGTMARQCRQKIMHAVREETLELTGSLNSLIMADERSIHACELVVVTCERCQLTGFRATVRLRYETH
eukprot:1098595-Pleurochrysis_carterae.AAC.8